MADPTGDSRIADVSSKPRSAAAGRSGDGPIWCEAWRWSGGSAAYLRRSIHREAKAHEGQVGCQDLKQDLAMRTDFHEDGSPEVAKRWSIGHPRTPVHTPADVPA